MLRPSASRTQLLLAAANAMLIVLAATGMWQRPAWAAQLEQAECDKLAGEEAQLSKSGIRAQMAKGPEWAKANLGTEGVERIRRLIELDEQIAFRCRRLPARLVPEGEETAAAKPKPKPKAKTATSPDGATKAAAAAPEAAAAKPKPKPKPKPATAAEDGAEPAKAPAKKAAAPKPSAAKKFDDAYRPTSKPADDVQP